MEGRAMLRLCVGMFALTAVLTGCSRERWPSPPSVDPSAYEKEHAAWLAGEQAYLSEILPVIGIWPLDEGANSFGSDRSLPIVLPATQVPALSGTFHRAGNSNTVVPAAHFALRTTDGSTLEGTVRYYLPVGLRRVGDYLNQRERWILIRTEEYLYIVNTFHEGSPAGDHPGPVWPPEDPTPGFGGVYFSRLTFSRTAMSSTV